MAGNFDPYDKSSWYFGPISRQEATDLLLAQNEVGVFLVRNSISSQGDLVLCVKEENKVSHYIINRILQGDQMRFRIGDQAFPDIPSLLNFYRLHYLDTTSLLRPVERKIEKVRAKYDFEGSGDPDDLPFKKGEILYIISKDEEQWWTGKNRLGKTGSIPVPYVEKIDDDDEFISELPIEDQLSEPPPSYPDDTTPDQPEEKCEPFKYNIPNVTRKLPALARVKQARVPNAYDKTALKLEIGDIVKVTKININGQWEGELLGKVGHFPFTHVEFIDSDNPEETATKC